MPLSKADILGVSDQKIELVPVPEWGGEVYIRGMTGVERDLFEEEMYGSKKVSFKNARARLLVRCLCDEKGQPLFTAADVEALGAKSAKPLDRLFSKAQKLSGIGRDDLEEMVKNSGPQGGEDSSTVSP